MCSYGYTRTTVYKINSMIIWNYRLNLIRCNHLGISLFIDISPVLLSEYFFGLYSGNTDSCHCKPI